MTAAQLIRGIVSRTAWTQNKLGRRLGLSASAMSQRMNASDVKVSFLVSALEAMGYQLVAVPAETRLPNGAVLLDGVDESLFGGE